VPNEFVEAVMQCEIVACPTHAVLRLLRKLGGKEHTWSLNNCWKQVASSFLTSNPTISEIILKCRARKPVREQKKTKESVTTP